jgi:hypothetical protein
MTPPRIICGRRSRIEIARIRDMVVDFGGWDGVMSGCEYVIVEERAGDDI